MSSNEKGEQEHEKGERVILSLPVPAPKETGNPKTQNPKTQKHRNTETQKHRNTETRKHGNTETRKHGSTETRKHRKGSDRERGRSTEVPGRGHRTDLRPKLGGKGLPLIHIS